MVTYLIRSGTAVNEVVAELERVLLIRRKKITLWAIVGWEQSVDSKEERKTRK